MAQVRLLCNTCLPHVWASVLPSGKWGVGGAYRVAMGQDVVAHACNPCTQEAEAGDLCGFKASLVRTL